MDTLWSVLALGSDAAKWGAGYPRGPRKCAGSGAGRASALPLSCKVVNVTTIWVGEEGHSYLEDF